MMEARRLASKEDCTTVSECGHFPAWLKLVDVELTKRCDLSHDDLADQPWRDWFDDDISAAELAEECLVNEGLL
jgi:hypothetical protein